MLIGRGWMRDGSPLGCARSPHLKGGRDRRSIIIGRMYSTQVAVSMSDIVTVIIGHRLGKVEAVRRLKEGFARTNGHLGSTIAMEQET